MKKRFLLCCTFIALTSIALLTSEKKTLTAKETLVKANLLAVTQDMWCLNDADCPLGMQCIENICSSRGSHTLDCGKPGIKMCEATCGRCNVTMKNWGNGSPSVFTCNQ